MLSHKKDQKTKRQANNNTKKTSHIKRKKKTYKSQGKEIPISNTATMLKN